MTTVLRLESLSDDALLARVEEVTRRSRRVEAELVWHLAEVDRRMLYRREACSSMHVYATSRLHLSPMPRRFCGSPRRACRGDSRWCSRCWQRAAST
jgi:hypothetical protein